MIGRLAPILALTVLAAWPAAAAAAPVTRGDFVNAYVACNNAAWTGVSRELIRGGDQETMSDKMRGFDTKSVRAFAGEQLYFEGVYGNLQPHAPATVGWALATKAFADRGEIEPRFRTRAAALAYLRSFRLSGADALGDRELGAIATELELTSRGARYLLTPIAPGTQLGDALDAVAARAMLARVGTHFDVGSKRTIPQSGKLCPARVLAKQFGGRR